jgi:L-lactate dehydrogenase complex protein LldG
MWDPREIPLPGLDSALARRGVRVLSYDAEDLTSADRRQELAGALVGITGAHAGLAETGSLVLASGPGRSRLASLLPPLHVAVLRRDLIVESLADLVAQRPELMTAGANVVCITGPSRTADIEHTLTRGVHGPREVHVVVVN